MYPAVLTFRFPSGESDQGRIVTSLAGPHSYPEKQIRGRPRSSSPPQWPSGMCEAMYAMTSKVSFTGYSGAVWRFWTDWPPHPRTGLPVCDRSAIRRAV